MLFYTAATTTTTSNMIKEFDDLFHEILQGDTSETKKTKLYEIGINCILKTDNICKKEEILNKLLFFFHERIELYYYMGYIFKDTDFYKSIMWFQLCFQKNPLYIDNLLDLLKILFDTDNIVYIYQLLDSNWDILKHIKDERFLLMLGAIYNKEKNYGKAYDILTCLMNYIENNDNTNNDVLPLIYLNISHLYSSLSDMEKSVFYLNQILKNESNIKDKGLLLLTYQTVILRYDYLYVDNFTRFEISQKINSFYIAEYNYKWRPTTKQKIKIGYVTNSFIDHAVSYFFMPILHNHDKNKFDIIVFTEQISANAIYNSNLTDKGIKIINILKKNANECADIVYNEGIDILIDLDGYTKHNRLDIFSKNPAPIQMTYIGYPNSLGLDFIKYKIIDKITDPLDSTQIYTETKLYMPKCFLLYKPLHQLSPIIPKFLTANDTIVLGAINREPKNSIEILEAWKTILHSTKNTVLFIKMNGKDVNDVQIKYYKEKLAIDSDRFIIANYCATELEYLKLFYKIDIVLDTFPYSGTTTTCNSLYNSIPVVTHYNKNYHVHNVSASILRNCGHEELIAYSTNEYVNKVVDLCNDVSKINWYKENIGRDFLESMNPEPFMKDYEELLTGVYTEFVSNSEFIDA